MKVFCLNVRKTLLAAAFTWAVVLLFIHKKVLKQHIKVDAASASGIEQASTTEDLFVSCGANRLKINGDKRCIKRYRWVKENWAKHSCFALHGITHKLKDVECYIYRFLVYTERVCPVPATAGKIFAEITLSRDVVKEQAKRAYIATSFDELLHKLDKCGKVCLWMKSRINSMEREWLHQVQSMVVTKGLEVENSSAKSFSAEVTNPCPTGSLQNINNGSPCLHDINRSPYAKRPKLTILLHMGLLTKQYGLNFGEAALNGGPLGELVQWSDLGAALHVLGHEVQLSWSPDRLRTVLFAPERNACKPMRKYDLIFTDIVGLEQLRGALGSLYHYRGLLRVLDVYGTDPEFNHPVYNPQRSEARTWGGRGLNPGQFFTHFPHSPDNSFLGFVVESKPEEILAATKEKKVALLYGKRSVLLQGKHKRNLLDLLQKHFDEVHATMWSKHQKEEDEILPDFVINHKNMEQKDFIKLLRNSAVYVGLGSPVEGPAALEAIANGVVLLNPSFSPPRPVAEGKPTKRKLTSQNPYAETAIGEPLVFTCDLKNVTEINRILRKIKEQLPKPSPYVPLEFTYNGFLERLNAYVENQDFDDGEIRTTVKSQGIFWRKHKSNWPPKSVLKATWSEVGESCTHACSRNGMMCERSLFPELNSIGNPALDRCGKVISSFSRTALGEAGDNAVHGTTSARCHAPSYDSKSEECILQNDYLLYSCACSPPIGVLRLCPCRKYRNGQRALCVECM